MRKPLVLWCAAWALGFGLFTLANLGPDDYPTVALVAAALSLFVSLPLWGCRVIARLIFKLTALANTPLLVPYHLRRMPNCRICFGRVLRAL